MWRHILNCVKEIVKKAELLQKPGCQKEENDATYCTRIHQGSKVAAP
jgi:hypothetical protein